MFKYGKLQGAVRMLTGRNIGGLYRPDNTCTKTGRVVLDVIRSKYREVRVPDGGDFDEYPHSEEQL